MGKGLRSFLRYPKLVCLCLIYVMFSTLFLIHIVPKASIKEVKLISELTDHAQDPNPTLEAIPTKSDDDKGLTEQGAKKGHSLQDVGHLDKNAHTELQCDMSHYLGLNKEICNVALNKGNNSLILGMIKGKNSILKESNQEALKNLAESIEFLKDVFKPRKDNCNIDKVTLHCDSLRKSYAYGKGAISTEEKLFPLAFALKIHTSANQAHRLLRYIYREHNIYCVHVDKKAPVEIYNRFKRIESCFDNIIVIKDRISVVYSTIRQVEAELKCMEAVSAAKQKWRYYINLTGQEFMLKTNLEIVKILKLLNGTNDIESYPVPMTEYHKFKQRTLIMNNLPIVTRQKKEPFGQNIKIHKGSAYGLFSRDFVNYVLNDNFVKDFLFWLRETYAPEELIWATLQILPGTPGGHPNVDLDRRHTYISRAVKWKMDKTVTCHGKYVHWICIFGLEDIPWLLSNRNIVANKFYEDYAPLALDCVEKEMYNRLINYGKNKNFDVDIYRKLLRNKM
ncbi:N-acetyllactosaminide beta-1,6-N-acetylglucosaminyl-transferase-like [Mercenaria mercenaria]|uniref:N-acetyllactosaminide beta-1,6-N-acetylglucosaminyl-transferase-like n=1 Tax=Mercenaria mercenaria TaxID=6596 RepID=UPI00234E5DFE|nr:N-acetyllactosaminide beta-1,6-N-acetylglucosaminyl-transferase-like [Mercenaria mercenaria]